MAKPKVAIFKFASCGGCQLQLLNIEDKLLDIIGAIDIVFFPMGKSENLEGPYDVGLVEGAITCAEEIERIKKVRASCRILVALGACACYGGIQSSRNWMPQRELEPKVYEHWEALSSTKCFGIDEYVPVDLHLHGCPVDREELLEVIKGLLMGTRAYLRPHSVCMECKLRENECLFLKGIPCMGPVARAGCGAVCPSNGAPCSACRGPANDANVESFVESLKEMGIPDEQIARMFRRDASTAKPFAKVVSMYG